MCQAEPEDHAPGGQSMNPLHPTWEERVEEALQPVVTASQPRHHHSQLPLALSALMGKLKKFVNIKDWEIPHNGTASGKALRGQWSGWGSRPCRKSAWS